ARGGLVRAVAISAYARSEDRQAALAAGYDDFLAKPAMPADVVRAVDRWLALPPRLRRNADARGARGRYRCPQTKRDERSDHRQRGAAVEGRVPASKPFVEQRPA